MFYKRGLHIHKMRKYITKYNCKKCNDYIYLTKLESLWCFKCGIRKNIDEVYER